MNDNNQKVAAILEASDADLSCVDFSDAKLAGADLTGATYSEYTHWPAGVGPLDGGGE